MVEKLPIWTYSLLPIAVDNYEAHLLFSLSLQRQLSVKIVHLMAGMHKLINCPCTLLPTQEGFVSMNGRMQKGESETRRLILIG